MTLKRIRKIDLDRLDLIEQPRKEWKNDLELHDLLKQARKE